MTAFNSFIVAGFVVLTLFNIHPPDEDESSLYIELLKSTVLNLQERLDKEKKRQANCNMYSTQPFYSYHKNISSNHVKPTYSSRSLVFVNPKMTYKKVNSSPPSKVTPTSLATTSTSLYRKPTPFSVNRALINTHKYNLTLKKDCSTNSLPKINESVAQTSTAVSCSIDNHDSTKQVIGIQSEAKALVPCSLQKSTVTPVTSLSKSIFINPVLIPPNSLFPAKTCPASSTPKVPSSGTNLPHLKSKRMTLKSRYKIVHKHKPAASTPVVSPVTTRTSVSHVKRHAVNTRFNFVKKADVFTPKSGYSYVSKRCLHRAKVIGLSNSEAGKSYVKRLRKLIIDAGKKFDKKPLVMMSRRKISRVPVASTPNLIKRKSSVIPHKSKLKIDHRNLVYRNLNSSKFLISPLAAKHKLSPENQRKWFLGAKRFINPKFSQLQTVTVQGVRFRVEAGGKNLRRINTSLSRSMPSAKISLVSKVSRIHIGGAIFTRTSAGVLKRVSTHKLIVANRVVHKSIATAFAKNRKIQCRPAKKPCLYFNNFGKCKNKKCPYIHDPKKIAVCRRMIQGTCKVSGCPFYHKLAKEKMPTCFYFLKGQCSRDNCIYPHVKVNKNAKACEDFLNGYCNRGEKCTMKHFFVCQKFQENKVCSHNACKFKARQLSKTRTFNSDDKTSCADHDKKTKSMSFIRESLKKNSKLVPNIEPISIGENLSFISLGNSSDDSLLNVSGESTVPNISHVNDQPKTTLRIKPRL